MKTHYLFKKWKLLLSFLLATSWSYGQIVTTFAGSGEVGSINGTGTAASFAFPSDVATDSFGNFYVVDTSNNLIRKITASGVVTTLAGSGTAGFADGTGTAAQFNRPSGIVVDSSNNIYVSDYSNNCIRKITTTGVVTIYAGNQTIGYVNSTTPLSARFFAPSKLAIDASNNIYVADYGNQSIRKITPTGTVTTIAGAGPLVAGNINGTGTGASFFGPFGITVTSNGSFIYVSQTNNIIRKITAAGVVTTFAGSTTTGSTNGTGTAATFNFPTDVALDSSDNVYVADSGNYKIRKITSAGVVTNYVGNGVSMLIDGGATTSSFSSPTGLFMVADGTIYVADGGSAIRKVALLLPPTASAQTLCGAPKVSNLVATGQSGSALAWYSTATGGTALSSTTAVTTGTYYVSQFVFGEESTRTSVAVTVNTTATPGLIVLDQTNGVANASAGGLINMQKFVAGQSGLLNEINIRHANPMANSQVLVTLKVFEGAGNGGNLLGVVTKNLLAAGSQDYSYVFSNNINIYAGQTYTFELSTPSQTGGWISLSTNNAYTQGNFLPVNGSNASWDMIFYTRVSLASQSFCNSGTVANLLANGFSIKWYDVATGGTALTLTTALSTGTYYVTQTLNACESARVPVSVNINVVPPPTASTQFFCTSAIVSNLVAAGTNLKWYQLGTLMAPTANVPTGEYQVSQTVNGCESAKIAVAINIVPVPSAPVAAAQTFCGSATVSNLVGTGTDLKWYNTPTGGTALATNTALSTAVYYVSQTVNTCESSRVAVSITLNTTPAPSLVVNDQSNSTINISAGSIVNMQSFVVGVTGVLQSILIRHANPVGNNPTVTTVRLFAGLGDSGALLGVTTVNMPATLGELINDYVFANAINITAGQTYTFELSATNQTQGWIPFSVNNAYPQGSNLPFFGGNGDWDMIFTTRVDLTNQSFCGTTLRSSLRATGSSLRWYNVATNGTPLSVSDIITTGTYYVSQRLNNCESSRAAVNVTITPNSDNVTTVSACNSYVWNGFNYTASGLYTGTTTNCVTQKLSLTIIQSTFPVLNITACDSYTWNGTTYTQSGIYMAPTVNCVTQRLNLIITPSSINTTTATACDSYIWNGTTYTQSGFYTGATNNCVTQKLSLTITPSVTYYIDADGDGFGNSASFQSSCSQLNGYVINSTDCDDSNALINRNYKFYVDADNDGKGERGTEVFICAINANTPPSGFCTNFSDCDDNNPNDVDCVLLNGGSFTGCNFAINNPTGVGNLVGSYTQFQKTTFYPANANQKLQVTINLIAIGGSVSDLVIHNGNSENAPVLINLSNVQPMTSNIVLTSTAADGSLTFNDSQLGNLSGSQLQGISASISCVTASCLPTTYYQDYDGDGFGYINYPLDSCAIPALNGNNYVSNNFDCNDYNAASPVVNSINQVACDSYTWSANAQNYTQSGTYLLVGAGCIIDKLNLTILPLLTYYADADADGFGNASVSQMTCTAPVGYVLNATDCNDANANVNPSKTEILYNGIDDNCDGNLDEGNQIVTALPAAQCGIVMSNNFSTIAATQVVGATGYRFRVTNLASNSVQVIDRIGYFWFQFNTIADLTYETSYKIEVMMQKSGVWLGYYGTGCVVTTPPISGNSLTSATLASNQCGTTLANINSSFGSNNLPGVTGYRFKVTNTADNSVQTLDRTVHWMNLTMLPSYNYGVTYTVEVAIKTTGTTYSPYGSICTITAPAVPAIQSVCGTTIARSFTNISTLSRTAVTRYKFEVTNTANSSVQTLIKTVHYFSLRELTGIVPSTVYSVRVAFETASTFSDYGATCSITSPAAAREINGSDVTPETVSESFSVMAVPNPFTDNFALDLKSTSSEKVEVKVYDMIGKLLESRAINFNEINNFSLGNDYPSGVYNLIVSQDNNILTLRVIKR